MHLPIYVINLDRRPDRWEAITGSLGRLGLRPTRITAVDGSTASDEELKERVATDAPFLPMGRGSQANVLSHARAWEALLNSSRPAALVAEDDALFASDIGSVLGDDLAWWPDGAGLIQLEILRSKKRLLLGSECGCTPDGRAIYQVARWSGGTAGYLIDRRSAGIALDDLSGIDMPIDHLLFDVLRSPLARRLGPLQVIPSMVTQHGEDSDISGLKAASRSRGPAPSAAKPGRRLGIALRKLALTTGRATRRVRRIRVEFADRFPP